MQVKCNPLWNILNKSAWGAPIFLCVFLIITLAAAIQNRKYVFFIIACVVVLFINITLLLSYYPRSFCLKQGSIVYRGTVFSLHGLKSNNLGKPIRTQFTVTDIASIELRQNAIEKLCNTGRMIIKGHTDVEFLRFYDVRDVGLHTIYKEQTFVPEEHVLYGIKHFDKFRNEIYDHVDPAVLTINVER